MTLDPGSGLPTGPTVIEDFPDVTSKQCSEHWRRSSSTRTSTGSMRSAGHGVRLRPCARSRGTPSGARATGGSCDPWASTTSSGRCCVWVTRPGARSRSGAALAARRSALVAKLFAEYYERAYADHIVRVLGSERG
jgi:hypothetical protein